MCGRYTLYHDEEDLTELFALDGFPWSPRYNIAPTQVVPIVRVRADGVRERLDARWGLVPAWVKEPTAFKALLFNARSETAGEKPAFRDAARRARCALPASGFFEWRSDPAGGPKQPFFIHRRDGAPMAFAGLYAEGAHGSSATVLTTRPNAVVAQLHDRMPVILEPASLDRWLDPATRDLAAVADLLRPCADDLLEAYPVARAVGSARVDEARLVQRV
jgi:putative SOS response-associated peptidase YedK